jgi:putative hydrolase of the HAD superfamily
MVIFFDIDGTLIDQRKAEEAAAGKVLAAYGNLLDRYYSETEFCCRWRFLREKHARLFFAGLISLQEQRRRRVREFFAQSGRSLSQPEADAIFDFYAYHYRANWRLFDDVLPTLRSVSDHACGIISNGSAEQQKLKLRQTGIERYFDVIVVSEEAGSAKPQAEIFLTACRQASAPAHRCIYVGDRLNHDALASRAIGMRAIWLDRRNVGRRTTVEVISSLAELCWKLENKIAV